MNDILAMDNFKVGFSDAQPMLLRDDPIILDEDEVTQVAADDEAVFLGTQFNDDIRIADLGPDGTITPYLQERMDEI